MSLKKVLAALLQLGVLITLSKAAEGKSYTGKTKTYTVPALGCITIPHRLHANTTYSVLLSNVVLPDLGLQCTASDLLTTDDILSPANCQVRAPGGRCSRFYSKSKDSCNQEYARDLNGAGSSFVPLQDNLLYDNTVWSNRPSCTNGEGFLYMKNTCRQDIKLDVKINDTDIAAGAAGCAVVVNLKSNSGIGRSNLILAIVLPVSIVVLFAALLLLLFLLRKRLRKAMQSEPETAATRSGVGHKSPVSAVPGDAASLSAAPVAAKDAPSAGDTIRRPLGDGAVPSVPTAYITSHDAIKSKAGKPAQH